MQTSNKLSSSLALFTLTFAASCTHTPPVSEKPPEPQAAAVNVAPPVEDNVAYVNRASTRGPAAAAAAKYKTSGACGGFPKIDVRTAPGFCLGLVYDGGGIYKKLRWSAPVSPTRVVLTEMGGWAPFNGKILQLDYAPGQASKISTLISAKDFPAGDARRGIVNEPNQISKGPDGHYYVGGATGLYRFDATAANPASTVQVMISDIPGLGLHPLKTFAFDAKGENVYINVGAASNVCQNYTKYADQDPKRNPKNYKRVQFKSCPEVEDYKIGQGQIRRYSVNADRTISKDFKVFAKGMRNSIALTWDAEHDVLLEGDNGRDAINKFQPRLPGPEFPHEEINIVREDKHYGWPYCYDDNKNNPEWANMDCSGYTKPQLLLPPHSAPLGMIIYQGTAFPEWYKNRVLLNLHGYEAKGHRLVALKRDAQGFPTGVPQSVVFDWEKRGDQEKGKPVGLTELADGSVMIVEDEPQNKVLRLFFDPSQGNGVPVQEVDKSAPPVAKPAGDDEETRKARMEDKMRGGNVPPFTMFQHKYIDKTCFECHQADGAPGVQLIRYDDDGNAKRIVEAGKAKDILEAVKGDGGGVPAMPPQGWDSPAEQKDAVRLLEQWVKTLN